MTCVDEQLSVTLASVTHKYETVTTLDLFNTTGIYLSHFKVLLQVQHHQPTDLLLNNSLCRGYLVLYLVISNQTPSMSHWKIEPFIASIS